MPDDKIKYKISKIKMTDQNVKLHIPFWDLKLLS